MNPIVKDRRKVRLFLKTEGGEVDRVRPGPTCRLVECHNHELIGISSLCFCCIEFVAFTVSTTIPCQLMKKKKKIIKAPLPVM